MSRDWDDLLMAAHEALANEYMEDHPEATEDDAFSATEDKAWDRMTDNLADMADYAADRAKGDR